MRGTSDTSLAWTAPRDQGDVRHTAMIPVIKTDVPDDVALDSRTMTSVIILIDVDTSCDQAGRRAVMDFGTIGAGTVAQAIAGHLVAAGHEVS